MIFKTSFSHPNSPAAKKPRLEEGIMCAMTCATVTGELSPISPLLIAYQMVKF